MTRREYLGITATAAAAGLFGFLIDDVSAQEPNAASTSAPPDPPDPGGTRRTRFGFISDSEMRRNSAKLGATFEQDIPYLWRKYREQVCDPSTGLDNETIKQELWGVAEKLRGQPREVMKARCFAFVCENVTIDVSPHDWFPAFGCWDRYERPLFPLIWQWNTEVSAAKMKTMDIYDTLKRGGAADIWKDYDHSTPDWEEILPLGFAGLRERARRFRRERGDLDAQAAAYFDGIDIAYTAILATLDRFHAQALKRARENKNHPRLIAVANSIDMLRHGAPTNTYEVLLFIYLYFMFSEHIDWFQVRSLGNLAVIVDPYFQADLAAGRFTEAQAREFFAYFMMQFASINNYWGHPFFFGGTKANGETEINDLAYIILDVHDKLGITSPKLHLKIDYKTPQKFIDQAFDMIRRGNNSISFICAPGIRRAFIGMGFTEEDARTSVITGCYESIPRHCSQVAATYINILKPIELVLNNGVDPVSGTRCGIATGELESIKTFDAFYDAYTRQLGSIINRAITITDDGNQYLSAISPALVLSGAVENSLRTARDAHHTGSVHNLNNMLMCGFGTTIDALAAVRELVFIRREITLPELRDALRANWEGYESLRLKAQRHSPKYGNGHAVADDITAKLGRFISDQVNLRPDVRGGFHICALHAALHYVRSGRITGATPDGRKAGEEMSKNASPTMGMDTNGVTALINSVTALDSALFPGDFPLDVMLHPSTVAGDEGLAVMRALLKTFMDKNGAIIQFNIFDAETLIDAQKRPEKYEHLQVRVCGWNVRFNDLSRVEQDAFIRRAMNIKN